MVTRSSRTPILVLPRTRDTPNPRYETLASNVLARKGRPVPFRSAADGVTSSRRRIFGEDGT